MSSLIKKRSIAGTAESKTTIRLAPEKIAAAQRILRTTTATETIELALDMVLFRAELVRGTKVLKVFNPDQL